MPACIGARQQTDFPRIFEKPSRIGKIKVTTRRFSGVQDGCFKGNAEKVLPEWPWSLCSDFEGVADVQNMCPHMCLCAYTMLRALGWVRVRLGLYLIMVSVCRLLGFTAGFLPNFFSLKNLLQQLLDTSCIQGSGRDMKTFEPEPSIPVGTTRCEMQFVLIGDVFKKQSE